MSPYSMAQQPRQRDLAKIVEGIRESDEQTASQGHQEKTNKLYGKNMNDAGKVQKFTAAMAKRNASRLTPMRQL